MCLRRRWGRWSGGGCNDYGMFWAGDGCVGMMRCFIWRVRAGVGADHARLCMAGWLD
jgi:hypothetical protein